MVTLSLMSQNRIILITKDYGQFLDTKLFALLKLHVGICGFQFPEFPKAWQVELLDPDRLY